jgi:hypothetical protein
MPVLASQRPGAASAEQSPCSMATLPGAGVHPQQGLQSGSPGTQARAGSHMLAVL